MKAIAVIDQSTNGLFIYDINKNWEGARIEEFLYEKGHNMSNCSWGEFNGEIIDFRYE